MHMHCIVNNIDHFTLTIALSLAVARDRSPLACSSASRAQYARRHMALETLCLGLKFREEIGARYFEEI